MWLTTTCSVSVPFTSKGTENKTHLLFTFCPLARFIWAHCQRLPLVFRPSSPPVFACLLCLFNLGSDDTYSYNSFHSRFIKEARPSSWVSGPHCAGGPGTRRVWPQVKQQPLMCLSFVQQDICKSLWCHRAGHRCETKFMPAAEGTTCGPDMVSRAEQEYSFAVVVNPLPAGHFKIFA